MDQHNRTDISANDTDDLARMIRAAGRRPEPPQADRDAVHAAAYAAWQAKLRSRNRQRLLYALAASILIAITAALLWPPLVGSGDPPIVATARLIVGDVATFSSANGQWSPLTPDARDRERVRAGDRVRTAVGGRVELDLLPGTSLRLAESTEIEIGADRTLRLLSGRTYIDTGKDQHGIELETPFGTLRDIGTQFEVSVTDATLRLRVRTGYVELAPITGPTQHTSAEQQIELTREGRLARAAFPAAHPEWSWAEELAVVPLTRGQPHIAYLEWIAAETGRQLVFSDESARILAETRRLDGDPRGNTPAELLQIIAVTEAELAIDVNDEGTIRIGRNNTR